MKKINKNILNRPRNLNAGWGPYDNVIFNLGQSKCWPGNYSSIYRSSIVKDELEKIYYGKCAFCNQVPKGSPLQVEHFRPKNGVENEDHSGYYWLGYEWTNLLFACGNCNSRKNNHFPLRKGIIRVPGPKWINENEFDLNHCVSTCKSLRDEKYLLLNPELDLFEEHLIYLPDGKIHALTIRGEESIDKYNLNRDELYLDGRKELLDNLVKKIGKKLKSYTKGERSIKIAFKDIVDILEEELFEPIENNKSFDHFRYTTYIDFKTYILPRFGVKQHINLLLIVFNKLLQGVDVKLK